MSTMPPYIFITVRTSRHDKALFVSLIGVFLLLTMLLVTSVPAMAGDLQLQTDTITVAELRLAIPTGIIEVDTVMFRLVPVGNDTGAIAYEYWALPGRQVVVFSCWDDTRVAVRRYYDAPWLSLSDQLAGKHPLGSLFISGDRFFGLIETKSWVADNPEISKVLRDGRAAWQAVQRIGEQVRAVYWFDPMTGIPLGWQKWRNGSPWCEYRVTATDPPPAFPHELLAGPPTWYSIDGR